LQIVPCGHLQFGGVPTIPPEHAAAMHVPPRNTLPCGQSQPPPALGTMPSRHRGGAFAMSWTHRPPRKTLSAGQTIGVGRATGGGLVATTGGGGLVGAGRTRLGGFNGILSAGSCIGGGG